MKKIVERLEETNPDRIPAFKAAAASQVREILDKIDKFQCFVGENSDGGKDMVALMDYREDGMTTYMLFWIDGLVEEKVVCTPFMFSCTGNKKNNGIGGVGHCCVLRNRRMMHSLHCHQFLSMRVDFSQKPPYNL